MSAPLPPVADKVFGFIELYDTDGDPVILPVWKIGGVSKPGGDDLEKHPGCRTIISMDNGAEWYLRSSVARIKTKLNLVLRSDPARARKRESGS